MLKNSSTQPQMLLQEAFLKPEIWSLKDGKKTSINIHKNAAANEKPKTRNEELNMAKEKHQAATKMQQQMIALFS